MSESGAITRRMGRLDSDASPIIVDANGCAASSPANMRMVLPELPQSSGPEGAAKPAAPRPSMVTSGGSDGRADGVRETIDPRVATQARVEAQSAPGA